MFDRRSKNAEIFKDTEHMYRTNETLKAAVKNSIVCQKLILANDTVVFDIVNGHASMQSKEKEYVFLTLLRRQIRAAVCFMDHLPRKKRSADAVPYILV